ncbi:MAG: CdaR family protein [Fibrobacteraceae bacterium]|nr:CdaR family protein [Fibrobacteraceae bacterium]
MKHIGLKIIACIFGIALWFYVVSARTTEIDMEVPLVFARLPETLAIASRPASNISITIKGSAIDLIRLKAARNGAAKIVVDLHGMTLGTQRFLLSEENFVAPDFPRVHYVSSDRVAALEIELDTRIKRTVPVHLKNTFEAKDGFTIIGTPILEPDTITIAGARSALTRIFEITTSDDRYKELSNDQAYEFPLDFSKLPPYVYPSDSTVKVKISVQPLVRTSFQGIPVQLIGQYDHSKYSLKPATATVEVSGGRGALSQIRQTDIQLFVEFNRFAIEDADSLAPTVRILGSVKGFQVHPEKFYLKKENVSDSLSVEETK